LKKALADAKNAIDQSKRQNDDLNKRLAADAKRDQAARDAALQKALADTNQNSNGQGQGQGDGSGSGSGSGDGGQGNGDEGGNGKGNAGNSLGNQLKNLAAGKGINLGSLADALGGGKKQGESAEKDKDSFSLGNSKSDEEKSTTPKSTPDPMAGMSTTDNKGPQGPTLPAGGPKLKLTGKSTLPGAIPGGGRGDEAPAVESGSGGDGGLAGAKIKGGTGGGGPSFESNPFASVGVSPSSGGGQSYFNYTRNVAFGNGTSGGGAPEGGAYGPMEETVDEGGDSRRKPAAADGEILVQPVRRGPEETPRLGNFATIGVRAICRGLAAKTVGICGNKSARALVLGDRPAVGPVGQTIFDRL
jgi:hypothetical protein